MNDDARRAKALSAATAGIQTAALAREAAQLAAIRTATTEIGKHVLAWEAALTAELQAEVARRDGIGWPPSFVAMAGARHLEKHLNRLLGWWADPHAGHGMERTFLSKLARRAGAQKLADDVDRGTAFVVHVESAIDDSGKRPDLLVTTDRGVLLLENKLHAGESGNQYGPYLALLQGWAKGHDERRAVLCSRRDDPTPAGWDSVLRHHEMAALFRELGSGSIQGATTWARIAALTTAEAFEERDVGDLLAGARRLLTSRGGELGVRLREMRETADALAARPVLVPWKEER